MEQYEECDDDDYELTIIKRIKSQFNRLQMEEISLNSSCKFK